MKFMKILGGVSLAVVMVVLGVTASEMWGDFTGRSRAYKELLETSEAYVQLSDKLATLEVAYKSEKDLRAQKEKEWKAVVLKKNQTIRALSDATFLLRKHVQSQNGPDYSFTTKKGTKNYVLNELRVQGLESPALGYVLIKRDGKTYKRSYRLEFKVKNLQTIDVKTGRVKFYSKAFLIQKEDSPLKKRVKGYSNYKDVEYPLNITGGSVLYDPTLANTNPSRFMYAPSLNGGFNIGGFTRNSTKMALGLSFFGYGPHKDSLKYKLLQIGFGFRSDGKNTDMHLIPVSIRPLPKILRNTYIGPGIGRTEKGTVYFLNTSIGF